MEITRKMWLVEFREVFFWIQNLKFVLSEIFDSMATNIRLRYTAFIAFMSRQGVELKVKSKLKLHCHPISDDPTTDGSEPAVVLCAKYDLNILMLCVCKCWESTVEWWKYRFVWGAGNEDFPSQLFLENTSTDCHMVFENQSLSAWHR